MLYPLPLSFANPAFPPRVSGLPVLPHKTDDKAPAYQGLGRKAKDDIPGHQLIRYVYGIVTLS